MIKINIQTVQSDKPKLFATVEKVIQLNGPILESHLKDTAPGCVIDHSLFCRVEDDDGTKLHLELQTYIVHDVGAVRFAVIAHDVVIYESPDEYYKGRDECVKRSEKHGRAFDENLRFKI